MINLLLRECGLNGLIQYALYAVRQEGVCLQDYIPIIMENLLMMQIIPLIRRFIWIHYMRKVMIITTLESGMPGRKLHWNIIVRALIIQAIIIHITNQNIKSISEGKNFRNPEF
ncbi:hypothetical protein HMPREF1548_02001 [Clostridium sp. KLE 1755]|nr:hypothetical protein HMPREF1548_02001 [Clostridium sp. KLE 1755]